MENNKGEVVLFPKWKEKLRKEGLEAVTQHKYEEAVESLEPLLQHDEADDEVTTGLLIAWVGIGRYEEAENVCLNRMKVSESNYFQYLHIYITILFHDGKYKELMDLVDEVLEREDVPHDVRTQLWQMYNVSKDIEDTQKKAEEASLVEELQKAWKKKDAPKQYALIKRLITHSPEAQWEFLCEWLKDEETHPVVKTAIIEWFQSWNINNSAEVHKFNNSISIIPVETGTPFSHYIVKHIEFRLASIEQNNPAMYEIIATMLHRYIYIRYPFLPTENEVPLIIEALKTIGNEYLQLDDAPTKIEADIESYKQDIEIANQEYKSITGE
ncbi:tetratricopeptide repeat protein [Salimicrobium flavidum]|uniref:Tetratricopeptide repeat-containing protein n=1 Tax=Salimicrobium flavidum TaxID=570947 RepID=A0A1N7JNX6_9BACI|nr:tetratricopeptide repeat protein [Salimicrobium flavidum]SIS50961.1 hypothetical protein SAMN05421687_10734 [Salimicrobium flavidum]